MHKQRNRARNLYWWDSGGGVYPILRRRRDGLGSRRLGTDLRAMMNCTARGIISSAKKNLMAAGTSNSSWRKDKGAWYAVHDLMGHICYNLKEAVTAT